ncbi:hypothetical protein EV715DRAFT_196973 [Schizophyllum commune]
MSSSPKNNVVGTLVVVVLEAMHLTNKKAIGKQTPYCVVSFNGEKQRTRAINRAGQRAHWDQELRFTLYESEGSSSTPQSLDTPPELPPKQEDGPPKIKGGFKMQVACFAEGLKEPDLIGQTTVDLTRVLTKGEHDDWFDLSHKDRFAGQVSLQMTFWSNSKPPPKKTKKKARKSAAYGGPGIFVGPDGGESSDSKQSRRKSTATEYELYTAPYEEPPPVPPVEKLAENMGSLRVQTNGTGHQSFPSYDSPYPAPSPGGPAAFPTTPTYQPPYNAYPPPPADPYVQHEAVVHSRPLPTPGSAAPPPSWGAWPPPSAPPSATVPPSAVAWPTSATVPPQTWSTGVPSYPDAPNGQPVPPPRTRALSSRDVYGASALGHGCCSASSNAATTNRSGSFPPPAVPPVPPLPTMTPGLPPSATPVPPPRSRTLSTALSTLGPGTLGGLGAAALNAPPVPQIPAQYAQQSVPPVPPIPAQFASSSPSRPLPQPHQAPPQPQQQQPLHHQQSSESYNTLVGVQPGEYLPSNGYAHYDGQSYDGQTYDGQQGYEAQQPGYDIYDAQQQGYDAQQPVYDSPQDEPLPNPFDQQYAAPDPQQQYGVPAPAVPDPPPRRRTNTLRIAPGQSSMPYIPHESELFPPTQQRERSRSPGAHGRSQSVQARPPSVHPSQTTHARSPSVQAGRPPSSMHTRAPSGQARPPSSAAQARAVSGHARTTSGHARPPSAAHGRSPSGHLPPPSPVPPMPQQRTSPMPQRTSPMPQAQGTSPVPPFAQPMMANQSTQSLDIPRARRASNASSSSRLSWHSGSYQEGGMAYPENGAVYHQDGGSYQKNGIPFQDSRVGYADGGAYQDSGMGYADGGGYQDYTDTGGSYQDVAYQDTGNSMYASQEMGQQPYYDQYASVSSHNSLGQSSQHSSGQYSMASMASNRSGQSVRSNRSGMSAMSGMSGHSAMSGMSGHSAMSGMSGMSGRSAMSGMSAHSGMSMPGRSGMTSAMSNHSGMSHHSGMSAQYPAHAVQRRDY